MSRARATSRRPSRKISWRPSSPWPCWKIRPCRKPVRCHGATVQVDISQSGTNPDGSTWYGSPIGDLSGYRNLIARNVGELTIAGGTVAINTSGAVNVQQGSTVNVSGGSINYQGATVQTTKVVTPPPVRSSIFPRRLPTRITRASTPALPPAPPNGVSPQSFGNAFSRAPISTPVTSRAATAEASPSTRRRSR